MYNPKVSIAIPSYNHGKYISETIESILNQTFQDFEIIITDDGSSDNTVEVIKTFKDDRIKLFVFDENQGACKALNNCIINSKGKYFAYISSDDVWENDKIEKQVKYLDENPSTQVVFTKVKIIDEESNPFNETDHFYFSIFEQENRPRSEWLNHFFYYGNCICHPSIMIKRSVYDDIGLYNERLVNMPDFDMWVRLSLKYNFYILDEKLTKFRVRKDEKNVSGDKPSTNIRAKFERLHLLDHFLKLDDIEFFLKIFPESKKFGDLKNVNMIPYFLARLAYESNQDLMQLWALNILYDLMQSDKTVNQLRKDYNFGYPNFFKMSSEGDFFNTQALKDKDVGISKRQEWIREKDNAIRERDKIIHDKDGIICEHNLKVNSLNKLIDQRNEDFKNLTLEIENLKSNLFQFQYKTNYNRSFGQRLSSKFPSLFILFKSDGIKNALINIKSYRVIRKNNLFDIGYYLKNNLDVMSTGKDPFVHYLFHGYKENRNPSPNFDNDYYLKSNQDVRKLNINPLVHYSLYGMHEGRKTKEIKENEQIIKRIPVKKRKILEQKYGVSIIMPTYNRANIIGRAIDSVLKQTFHNFELIIIDDGSTDDTEALITEKYAEHLKNGKIKYLKQENKGVNIARNKGLATATGNIIAYLDSDNYWLDTYLEKTVAALFDNNRSTGYTAIDVDDRVRNRKFIRETPYDRNLLLNSNFIDLNVFVHKKFLY